MSSRNCSAAPAVFLRWRVDASACRKSSWCARYAGVRAGDIWPVPAAGSGCAVASGLSRMNIEGSSAGGGTGETSSDADVWKEAPMSSTDISAELSTAEAKLSPSSKSWRFVGAASVGSRALVTSTSRVTNSGVTEFPAAPPPSEPLPILSICRAATRESRPSRVCHCRRMSVLNAYARRPAASSRVSKLVVSTISASLSAGSPSIREIITE
mmetsp:Transcript_32643/g.84615  ORF Transcript_32643/g.84615 Transcript_32643/m.84615 type:complete len:212 (-) Transcript_32643:1035-1670(-)